MTTMLLWALLSAAPPQAKPADADSETIARIARSGRILTVAEKPSERLRAQGRLAPGKPPLLAFRYLDGKRRHRFGNIDLVMDDAGH